MVRRIVTRKQEIMENKQEDRKSQKGRRKR